MMIHFLNNSYSSQNNFFMDMQFGIVTVIILLGLGLTQINVGEIQQNEFFAGVGWGTLTMGCLWVTIRVYKSYTRK